MANPTTATVTVRVEPKIATITDDAGNAFKIDASNETVANTDGRTLTLTCDGRTTSIDKQKFDDALKAAATAAEVAKQTPALAGPLKDSIALNSAVQALSSVSDRLKTENLPSGSSTSYTQSFPENPLKAFCVAGNANGGFLQK